MFLKPLFFFQFLQQLIEINKETVLASPQQIHAWVLLILAPKPSSDSSESIIKS